MFIINRKRLSLFFLSAMAVVGLRVWLPMQFIPKSTANSCEIYKAYHANLEEGIPNIFRPISRSIEFDPSHEDEKTSQFQPYYNANELPRFFLRDTGNREMVKSEYAPEPYEQIIYEEFEFNSPRIFKEHIISDAERIGWCFKAVKNAPMISVFPVKTIEFIKFGAQPSKTEDGFVRGLNANFLTAHKISSPLFTTDKKYGLIFAESYCGGLCGHGGYFLFENINGDWQQIGFQTRWMS